MKETLDSVQDQMSRQASVPLREKNTRLPIHALPAELLVNIFFLVLGEYFLSGERYILSSVCSHWRQVIAERPSLWACVSTQMCADHAAYVLSRSGDCPIDVLWGYAGQARDDQMDGYPVIPSAKTQIMEDIHRWRSVSVDSPSFQDLQTLCLRDAPLLESFTMFWQVLSRDRFSIPNTPFDLFRSNAPRLRHITAFNVPNIWDSDIFSRLVSLRISHCAPLLKLLQVLEASHGLENLHLSQEVLEAKILHASIHPVIHLARLQSLHLCTIHHTVAFGLLSRLVAPNVKKFKLVSDQRPSFLPHNISVLQITQPVLLKAAASFLPEPKSMDLGILVTRDEWMVESVQASASTDWNSEDENGYHLNILPCSIGDPVHFLTQARINHVSMKLRLSFRSYRWLAVEDGDTETFSPELLEMFPRINSLHVAHWRNADQLIKWLSDPYEKANGEVGWRLPRLEEMIIALGPTLSDDMVLEMVEKRYGLRETHLDATLTAQSSLPRPFKRVVVSQKYPYTSPAFTFGSLTIIERIQDIVNRGLSSL